MNGEHGEEYLEAMGIEMQALQRAVTWDVVPRSQVPRTTNILLLTWVYKLKCYSDGHPRKFKAQLCVRGDKQIKGIGYTDKCAPVVSLTTMQCWLSNDSREIAHKAG